MLEYLEEELFARALRECSGTRIDQSDGRIEQSDGRTERLEECMERLDERCMKQYIQVRPFENVLDLG